jgi:DNA-binding HxlR family transcriptional regulator
MGGSLQYCPVFKASEILGDRWVLLILREMLVGGETGFNRILRGLPGISRSVLTDRMRMLERVGVVSRSSDESGRTLGYHLTPAGRDLKPVLLALGEWGATWQMSDGPLEEELLPELIVLSMARMVKRDAVPPGRTVIQFDFRRPKWRAWMVLEPSEVSICLQYPGFDVDLAVRTDTGALYRVYLGQAELGGLMKAGKLALDGSQAMQRGFCRQWFGWSNFASASREAVARRKAAEQLPSRPAVTLRT